MLRVRAAHVDALLAVFAEAGPEAICVPLHSGRRGLPVLFGVSHQNELRTLRGDQGARSLLETHPECVHEVPVADDGIHFDIDTAEDLRALR